MTILSATTAKALVKPLRVIRAAGLIFAFMQVTTRACHADEIPRPADLANLTTPVGAPNSTSAATTDRRNSDLKTLWRDPEIRDFIGLSENAWDFNDPRGAPGFGPLSDVATEAPR